jgi:sugar phosphate isomerase/epimerase
LETLIPVSPYIHGKFYILDDGQFDPCIPYHEILPRVKALGYEGFIAAEYEGHHFDMSINMKEQLERYASLFHKYLD